jgi:hypothetical protein
MLHRDARSLLALVVTLAALAAAGCGGAVRSREPAIPTDLAGRLASASDTTAGQLAHGDACGAASSVKSLESEANVAVSTGRVPPTLAPELTRRVRALAAAITCTPPAPTVEEPQGKHDRGKHKGQENHGKRGQGGDE